MDAPPQNKGLSCGIYDNNYDLEECALTQVQIIDISYRLRLTPPRQVFLGPSSQTFSVNQTLRTARRLPFPVSYLDRFALRAVC